MAISVENPLTYNAANPGQTPAQDGRPEKFLVFAVGPLNLALAIAGVVKILPHNPIHGSGLTDRGLVNLPDRSLTFIDLQRRLLRGSTPAGRQYLIWVKPPQGEEFCLGVPTTPTLMDVSPSRIRALPHNYRQHDSLACASHVLLVEQQGEKFTIFLLDPSLLLSA